MARPERHIRMRTENPGALSFQRIECEGYGTRRSGRFKKRDYSNQNYLHPHSLAVRHLTPSPPHLACQVNVPHKARTENSRLHRRPAADQIWMTKEKEKRNSLFRCLHCNTRSVQLLKQTTDPEMRHFRKPDLPIYCTSGCCVTLVSTDGCVIGTLHLANERERGSPFVSSRSDRMLEGWMTVARVTFPNVDLVKTALQTHR